jgi:hypothetical protein
MKAQRRQELKANSLLWHIQGLPEQIKKYQSQIALVFLLIALAIVLIRYRMNAATQRLYDAQAAMAISTDDLDNLRRLQVYAFSPDQMDRLMKAREEAFADGLQQADTVFQKAPDSQPAMKAQALLAKGDLNFEMANFAPLPGAATRPELRPAESDESLLTAAAEAFSQVIDNYPDQKFAVAHARLGLAAVNENRGNWDDAKKQYQAIIDSDADQGFKYLAAKRIALLAQISQPVMIDLQAAGQSSHVTAPSTAPTTMPAIVAPTMRK